MVYRAKTPEFNIPDQKIGVCYGDDIKLEANEVANYTLTWSNGAINTKSITLQNVVEDTSYTVTASTDECTATKKFIVLVKENPVISVDQAPEYVCINDSALIKVSSNDNATITWMQRNDNVAQGSLTIQEKMSAKELFSFKGTISYEVEGQSKPTVCQSTVDTIIDIKPLPIVMIQSENAICYGDAITMNTEIIETAAPYTYEWRDTTVGVTHTDLTTSRLTVYPKRYSSYFVKIHDAFGCADSTTHEIAVNDLPIFNVVSEDQTVCDGLNTKLIADKPTLLYNWGTGEFSSKKEYFTPAITRDANKEFVVTARDANGCTSNDTITIGWKPNPEITIHGKDIVCYNEKDTLYATDTITSGITTYVWNLTGVHKDTFISDAITSVKEFSVVGTNNKCSSSQSITISYTPLPNIAIDRGKTDVCYDGDIQLTATGGVKYKWDVDSETTFLENNDTKTLENITKEKQVTVWGMDNVGCINKDNLTITVNPRPRFSISGDTIVCVGGQTTLYAKSDLSAESLSFEWTVDGQKTSGELLQVNNLTADKEITVKATNSNLCDSTMTLFVRVKEYPTITVASKTDSVCKGGTATINIVPVANATIQWFNAANRELGTDFTLNETVNVNNTKYTAKVSFSYPQYNGSITCTSSETYNIATRELPYIEIFGDKAVCINTPANLTATDNMQTYEWYAGDNTTAFSTDKTVSPSPTTNTTYRVIAEDQYGCKNQAEHLLVVNELPTFNLSSESKVCKGQDVVVFTDNYNLTYDWENKGYQSLFSNSYTIDEPTTITVSAMDPSTKCVKDNSIVVGIKEFPTMALQYAQFICEGDSTVLRGNNPHATYTWRLNNEAGQLLSTADTCKSGMLEKDQSYYVEANVDGCVSNTIVTVATWSLPNIKIENSPNYSVCKFTDLELVVTGGVSYLWEGDESYTANNTMGMINISTQQHVSVWGIDANGCKNWDEITISINETPRFSVSHKEGYCENETAVLEADNSSLSYIWMDKNGNVVSRAQTYRPVITSDTVFSVIGTNSFGCDTTVEDIFIKKYDYAKLQLDNPAFACKGNDVTVTAQALDPKGNEMPCTFVWNGLLSEDQPSITRKITKTTDFSVVATTVEGGCETKSSFTIGVMELPNITARDTTICRNTTALLTASSTTASTYSWYLKGDENVLGTGSDYKTNSLNERTTFTVMGTDQNNCVGTKDITVHMYNDPIFSLTSNGPVCKGDEAVIQANNPGLTYDWGSGFKTDLR